MNKDYKLHLSKSGWMWLAYCAFSVGLVYGIAASGNPAQFPIGGFIAGLSVFGFVGLVIKLVIDDNKRD